LFSAGAALPVGPAVATSAIISVIASVKIVFLIFLSVLNCHYLLVVIGL
jgi:hypothetical protein